jgi:subfamily B ATP-binding cassette protein MsbA
MSEAENIGRREKFRALLTVARYRPYLTAAIIGGGIFTALLEGLGVGFILPIVEIVRSSGDPAEQANGIMQIFVSVYQFLGVPFSLGTVIAGVSIVLTVRWTSTFVVHWLRSALAVDYTRSLQKRAFDHALDARIEYFDHEGSDEILNAIVTQAEYAARSIKFVIIFIQQMFLAFMYLSIALVVSPLLTLFAVVFLGGLAGLFRYVVEPGYDLGDELADANEDVQVSAQAGTQGIRDAKLFGMKQEIFDDFLDAVNQFARAGIRMRRNEHAIKNFYNLLTAVAVFVLIYAALTFADLSLGSLGVFLFAMFRLGPKASAMNSKFYKVENNLPHLIRTQEFIKDIQQNREPAGGTEPVPEEIRSITFDDVQFSYLGQDENALSGVSFEFEKGDFIGFVGQSGAGKSTIVSILVRMYEPDSGEVLANERQIHDMDIDDWRSKIAVVRQDPYMFNSTLRYNLTIGNRSVSEEELERVTRIAMVEEFFDELPNGYETELGDEGVRLSGGQRQRVALARALLKDAEVLVLDEATSDLDSNLEKEVQKSIENMERDYAIVGIAHRLSTVKNADRIYSLDDGEIVETGQHEELIGNDGQYSELYSIQSGG